MLSEVQWHNAPLTKRERVAPESDVIHFCEPDGDAAQRERSLGGLLERVREMAQSTDTAQSDAPPRRLFVVARGASAGGIDAAMALSLGRTVALEHPDLRCRSLEIDADLSADEADTALAEELEAADGEQWVRRSLTGRLVPRVVPLELAHQPFTPHPSSCYLVTGGFGGIGRMLAAWLVERGARDVMLLGRTVRELPEAAAWRERGVRLRCVAADVADPPALAAALAPLGRERVPIAGVFHAAGIQDDALLFQHEWPRFAEVLRAKVDGAHALREATSDQPLDTFVLFSSVGALCGLVGAGAYVAANAALGALARLWRAQGVPALSIQWGTWQGSGMASAGGTQLAKHWEALGIVPFDAASGTAALETLMASGRTEAIAAKIDWARLERWARSEGIGAPMYRNCVAPEAPATAERRVPPAPAARIGDGNLHDIVKDAVAKVLGLPSDHPSLERSFGELGLGSLAAIELRTQLAAALGIAVPATLAFNHPSVDAVVKFLGKRLRDAKEPVLPAP